MEVASDFLIQWLFQVFEVVMLLLDIPTIQTVDLPNAFESMKVKSVTSIECIIWSIDVHQNLTYLVPFIVSDFKSMASDITCIHLPDEACNDLSCSTHDFSRFVHLEE